jgi:hypothetical protein
MKTMTEHTEDSGEPSSTAGGIASPNRNGNHLHVVKGSSTARDDQNAPEKNRDTSVLGFLKSMISGKSETTLHEALKEFVADGDGLGARQSLAPDERTLI